MIHQLHFKSTPLSRFTVEDREYVICILESNEWKITRLQAFRYHKEVWTGEYDPTEFYEAHLFYSNTDMNITIDNPDSIRTPNWYDLLKLHPKSFPVRGSLIGVSNNLYRAISSSPEFIERTLPRVIQQHLRYAEPITGKEAFWSLLENDACKLFVDCHNHMANRKDSLDHLWVGILNGEELRLRVGGVGYLNPGEGLEVFDNRFVKFKHADTLTWLDDRLVLKSEVIVHVYNSDSRDDYESYQVNYISEMGEGARVTTVLNDPNRAYTIKQLR